MAGRRVVLGRGHAYQVMVSGLIVLLGVATVVAVIGVIESGGAGFLSPPFLFFFVFGMSFLPGVFYYLNPRILETNDSGIRLLRGAKTHAYVSWNQVTKVAHGTEWLTSWIFIPHVTYTLHVRGRSLRHRIDIDNVRYQVPRQELESIASLIEDRARALSIPVTLMSVEEARQTRLAGRLFGPDTNTKAIGGAFLTGSVLAAFLYGILAVNMTFAILAGTVIFGFLFGLFAYVAWTSRRLYCPTCDGYRIFHRRKGQLRCSHCKRPF